MDLEVVLHSLAENDIVQAWEWYEQKLTGLGDRFLAAVSIALERVAQWPRSGRPRCTTKPARSWSDE